MVSDNCTVYIARKEQTMKFLVDEMPGYDECPFNKEAWTDVGWSELCTLVNKRCNLYEGYSHECYGLKWKEANDEQ